MRTGWKLLGLARYRRLLPSSGRPFGGVGFFADQGEAVGDRGEFAAGRDAFFAETAREQRADRGDQRRSAGQEDAVDRIGRSEEHTSELQSLMRISYAVFCLKKKKPQT